MRWMLLLVVVTACGPEPRLQPHRPMKTSPKADLEPKCADNPTTQLCSKDDLLCSLDSTRGCYACQCQALVPAENPDRAAVQPPR